MKQFLKPLAVILMLIPILVIAATFLWNTVLVEAVTFVNPISPWQMTGLMVLYYIMFPGNKSTFKTKK